MFVRSELAEGLISELLASSARLNKSRLEVGVGSDPVNADFLERTLLARRAVRQWQPGQLTKIHEPIAAAVEENHQLLTSSSFADAGLRLFIYSAAWDDGTSGVFVYEATWTFRPIEPQIHIENNASATYLTAPGLLMVAGDLTKSNNATAAGYTQMLVHAGAAMTAAWLALVAAGLSACPFGTIDGSLATAIIGTGPDVVNRPLITLAFGPSWLK